MKYRSLCFGVCYIIRTVCGKNQHRNLTYFSDYGNELFYEIKVLHKNICFLNVANYL